MSKIYAPNKKYSGESASVTFVNGVGETEDEHLIQWFKEHGYEVINDAEDVPGENQNKALEEMTIEELMAYAQEKGIDTGKSTSQEGILKKIQDAEKVE